MGETRKQYTFFENDRCIVVYLVIFPTYFIMMTTRGLRFASNEERTKLLDDNDDNIEVRFSGSPKVTKKRVRKLSDDEAFDLVDVGNVPKAPPQDQCVETEVQPGDTLASLSLKYNIPVAELKRVNNIVTETHFYALKRMKIPVKTASLLTEMLPSVHEAKGEAKLENGWFVRDVPSPVQSGGTSSLVSSSPPSESEFELNLNHNESSENYASSSKSTKKAKKFLKNVDKDLARIKERLDLDGSDEELETFNSTVTIPNHIEDHNSNVTKSGLFESIRASQGRTACCLFIVIICVIIIVILIFAHYEFGAIEEKHHHHFKPDSTNQT